MTTFAPFINSASAKYDISPQLIAAIILQESSGNPNVSRWEPEFFKRYIEGRDLQGFIPVDIDEREERIDRATSWGLMQIMGEVAREFGYKGYLAPNKVKNSLGLCDPETNIMLGTRIFARYLMRSGGVIEPALLRWNGGGNPLYPKQVMEKMKSGRTSIIC